MKELKKGDQMHQSLRKIKKLVVSLLNSQRFCMACMVLPEIQDLSKMINERVFEASNEADAENAEVSFNEKNQSLSRGQGQALVARSRCNNNQGKLSNKLSSILPEEELDVRDYMVKSPFLEAGLGNNMVSAIGLDAIKSSPFLDGDNMFEF